VQQTVGSQASTAPFRNKHRGLGLLYVQIGFWHKMTCHRPIISPNQVLKYFGKDQGAFDIAWRSTDERITESSFDYVCKLDHEPTNDESIGHTQFARKSLSEWFICYSIDPEREIGASNV